jgi:DNA-binding XRE family transcriptional regulator
MMAHSRTIIFLAITFIIWIAFAVLFVTLVVLVIRALLKYIHTKPVREEQSAVKRSLGETIRAHRTRCQMTQEFVAESLGVSRQAVSKWEQGSSDPSTSNLLALAKLFGISAEELLREAE